MLAASREKLIWSIEYPSHQLRISEAFRAWMSCDLDHFDELLERLEPLSADRLRIWLEENEEDPESGEVPLAFRDLHPSLYICQLEPVFYQGQMVSVQGQMMPVLTMLQETPLAETHRIQMLYHQGQMGIVITDPLDRIKDCNPVFGQMLGLDQSRLLGDKIIDHIHPADRDRQLTLYDQMRYGDAETVHVEKRYLRADGTYFWAEVAITLIRNATGEISHFLRLIVDLSERKQLNQERQLQLQLIDEIYSRAPQMMGLAELEGKDFRLLLVNPATEAFAYPHLSRLEGRSARELELPETARRYFNQQLQACLSEQRIRQFESVLTLPDATQHQLACTLIPVSDPENRPRACFLIQHQPILKNKR